MAGQPGLAPHPAELDAIASGRLLPTGGTYALVLALERDARLQVGALGTWAFPKGTYLYVGSAWGPGGLRARVGRHVRGGTALRWHIDYLRAIATPVAVWVASGEHLECTWAQAMIASPAAEVIVPRFGASDCRCASHLFRIASDTWRAIDLPGAPQWLPIEQKNSAADC